MRGPKKVKLGEIAEIINGVADYPQHEKNHMESPVTYNYIQPKHLGDFNDIIATSKIVKPAPVASSCLVRKNDILLKRLNSDVVALIEEELSDTIVSNNLFVIRVSQKFFPAYIACFLETHSLAGLNFNVVGSLSAIKSISAKALALLDIPAIEYEKQEIIGNLWLLCKKRKQLLDSLMAADELLMAAVINKVAL